MKHPHVTTALREKAISLMEAALLITGETGDHDCSFLIERALDQLRANAWPAAIAEAPASH
ncbi:MAG TPA: hypothetical protein VH206_17500 [Xanthobacteraceae bacterium]|jgi:hypothetical protein|nr:hypothetical protein [Xanthobacteraceae bacterium]